MEDTKVVYHLNGKLQVELIASKPLRLDILSEILKKAEKGQAVKLIPTTNGGMIIEVEG